MLGCGGASTPAREPLPLTVSGFSSPESVLYDAEADVYLVSNLNGKPDARDHNGFISKVSPDGELLDLRLVDGQKEKDGLSAPKGMALVGRTLFVTDIDCVRTYDADSGAPKGVVAVPGAVFLNDAAAAPDGTVYVSDTALAGADMAMPPSDNDAIVAVKDGQARRVAHGASLGHPNGVIWNQGKLEMVTFATGEWLTIDPASGAVLQRTKLPKGLLDGVVVTNDGALVATSWESSAVYGWRGSTPAAVVLHDVKSPADLGYDSKRNRLLVPQMMEDRLLIASAGVLTPSP
jgi:hypothetical protein